MFRSQQLRKKGRPNEPRRCDNFTDPVYPVKDDHGGLFEATNYVCKTQQTTVRNPYEAKPTVTMVGTAAAVLKHAGTLVQPNMDVYFTSL